MVHPGSGAKQLVPSNLVVGSKPILSTGELLPESHSKQNEGFADIAQLVEHNVANVEVAGSRPAVCSNTGE